VLPDSTILLDYMHHLAIRIIDGLDVDPARMRQNLELTHGALFSQRVLLALIADGGRTRDEAYRITQELAQRAWAERTPLRELLATDPRTAGLELEAIFDYGAFTRHAPEILARLEQIAPS